MSQRSKNLLEAFNQSKASEKSAEPVAQPRGSAPRVGGPFADSAPAARPKAQPKLYDARPNRADVANSPRARWRTIVLCAGIAVIFFFIGRVSVPTVQAANNSPTPAPQAAQSAPPSPIAPEKTNAQGNQTALLDRANQATILAATYNLSDDNEKIAKASCAHLIAQGLPAAVWRYPERKQIFLLVGAAPKGSDLDKLLVQVKSASSDRGRQEFATARAVPIDSYVVRKLH